MTSHHGEAVLISSPQRLDRDGASHASQDDGAADHRGSPRPLRFLAAHAFVVSLVIVFLGALGLSTVHVLQYPVLSPVDELQHIDYLYKAPQIVVSGEKVGQQAMREQACRGLPAWPQTPACSPDNVYDPDDFQELGTNTAAIYTPFYYTVTKALAIPLKAIGGFDSLVTAARLVNGLWLAAGLALCVVIGRKLGANCYVMAAILLGVACTPTVLLPAATITPDSMSILCGAGMLGSVMWWERAPWRRLWAPAVVSVLVVAVKALNIIVVGLVILYVLFRLLARRLGRGATRQGVSVPAGSARQTWSMVGLIAVVPTAVTVAYTAYVSAHALASSDDVPMQAGSVADHFPFDGILKQFGSFLLTPNSDGWFVTTGDIGVSGQRIISYLLLGGVFAAALFGATQVQRVRMLALATAATGLVGSSVLIVANYVLSGIYVGIPGRYALSMIPAVCVVAGAVSKGRIVRVTWIIGAALFYLATVGALLVHY